MKNFSATENTSQENRGIINVFSYLFYSLVIAIGVPGNVLVIWSLMSIGREQVNRSYKMLVINLAINDIILVLLTVFTVAELANGDFPFGAVMCLILYPVQTACFGAGVFNMVALNFHRYYVISHSTRSRSLERMTVVAVILCWLIPTVITSFPYAVHLELNTNENETVCDETWPKSSSNAYTLYLFAVQYLLPLLIIATLNTLTIRQLKRSRLFRLTNSKTSEDNLLAHKRIVKMLVFIVLIFAIFGLPGQIIWLLPVFTQIDSHPNYLTIFSLVDVFPFMYCVLNPVLFFTYNIECRKNLKKFLSSYLFCNRYQLRQSCHLSSATGLQTDTVVTMRISESQHASQRNVRELESYATVIPNYLQNRREKHCEDDHGSTDNEAKQFKGLVSHAPAQLR